MEKINLKSDSSEIDLQTIAQKVPPWLLSSNTLQKLQKKTFYKDRNDNSKTQYVFFVIKFRMILLFIAFFSSISLFFLKTKGVSKNIIIYYYSNLLNYFLSNINSTFLLFFLLLILILAVYISDQYVKRFKSLISKLLLSLLTAAMSLLLGFLLSFPTLLLVGSVHLNLIAGYVSLNPISSINYGASEVLSRLKQMRNSPTVVPTNDVARDLVSILTEKQSNKFSAYYRNYLLNYIPHQLIYKPAVRSVSLLMFEDKLLFRNIDNDEIKIISPDLGKLLVMDYLKGRYVKDKSSVIVLGRQDFLHRREKQINNVIKKIDISITQIKTNISILNETIQKSKQKINVNEDGLKTSINSREVEYSQCLTSGFTGYYGEFYRLYTDQYCINNKNRWDYVIAEYQKNIFDWTKKLEEDQTLLSINLEYEKSFDTWKDIWAGQKDSTIYELGIFDPPNTITLAIDFTNNEELPVYLYTLVHEYYHYTSYVSDERVLPSFFEEGLTEYFTHKTVKQELGSNLQIGYPVIVAVVTQMAKKIPDDTLLEIYLTKDKSRLVSLLNNQYGADFYNDYEVYFETLNFFGIEYQIKVANDLMYRIGGPKISEKLANQYKNIIRQMLNTKNLG